MRMRGKFLAAALGGTLILAGCGGRGGDWRTIYGDVIDPAVAQGWRITAVEVLVPTTLTVSEENRYAPQVDIVWRGEPFGDRYQQVDRIITEAASAGAAGLTGGRAARLTIVMSSFHALTERTRYTLEDTGVHNIAFTAQVVDAATGEALSPVDTIRADLIAYSGREAAFAEARGETQRARIVAHVTKVIAGWLGTGEDVRGAFKRRGR